MGEGGKGGNGTTKSVIPTQTVGVREMGLQHLTRSLTFTHRAGKRLHKVSHFPTDL